MLRIGELLWDDWNEEHIARRGVDRDEVEDVCFNQAWALECDEARIALSARLIRDDT